MALVQHIPYFETRPPMEYMDESDNGPSTLMRHEVNRLMSFTNWPISFLDSESLAKAGFFYLHHDDAVKCAFCGIILGQWQEGDDPMADHRKWSEACPFVQGRECSNVPIELDSSPMNPPGGGHDVCGRYEFQMMPNSLPERETGQLNSIKYHGLPHREPVYAEYATFDQRLKTFKSWPATSKLKPEILAAAGFFYQGVEDRTVCFYCRGGLNNWEDSDDAWEQHAKWFPRCGFILLQKGNEYVESIRSKLGPAVLSRDEALSLEFPKSSTTSTTPNCESVKRGIKTSEPKKQHPATTVSKINEPSTSTTTKPKEIETKELSKEDDSKSSDCVPLCKICYVKEVGVLFIPCGHTVSCVDCSFAINSCPICREPLNATVRAFLS